MRSRAWLLALVACASEPDGRARFEREVAPVLERRCSAPTCHGVAEDADVVDWDRLFFRTDRAGKLLDLEAAYASAKRVIVTAESPDHSTLLRKPLPRPFGGLAHVGGDNFSSPADPDYLAIRAWIAGEREGGEDEPPLEELEAEFERSVQPALAASGCMIGNCHGLPSAVPFRLDPGVGGEISRRATRENYEASRRMISLDGEPRASRLIRKGLPLHAGGILHRGGNTALFTGPADPRVKAIEAWACSERIHRLGAPCAGPPMEAMVFVRGPLPREEAFELDSFAPGTDLFLARFDDALAPTSIENLTAAFHDSPADVRDPAVDHRGTTLAFAMRRASEGGHDLYLLELATRRLSRLTDDAGPRPDGGFVTHREPTFGPDGNIWFVSTRGGRLADGGRRLDADLYELDPRTGALTQRTFTPHVERKPVFLVHGEENGGEVAFTALRDAVPAQRKGHPFRFPPSLSTEYHQHFGITPPEALTHDLRELPDGRYLAILSDLEGRWGLGRLALIDRNFGPELSRGEPSMPGYAPPVSRFEGAARDPAPLADGRIVVAVADELASPRDLRIELLRLGERVDRGGARVVERRTLIDEPGVHDWDPEPIYLRDAAPTEEPKWDPASSTGTFLHNGLPLIDAVLANLLPGGEKPMRDDLRAVRLVEPLPLGPADLGVALSLRDTSPARILAEFPLAADGTFFVRLPAGVPFRVQGLDAEGRAVGKMHNRWYYVAPGQKLVQGASTEVYLQRCSTCHGSLSGDPGDALVAPDIITAASITASRYEGRNPRRPLPPRERGPRIEIDFARDVQPMLTARCATSGCHDTVPPRLVDTASGAFSLGYRGLMPFVGASAIESPLLRSIGRHAPLAADEGRLLIRWLDLGASFVGTR